MERPTWGLAQQALRSARASPAISQGGPVVGLHLLRALFTPKSRRAVRMHCRCHQQTVPACAHGVAKICAQILTIALLCSDLLRHRDKEGHHKRATQPTCFPSCVRCRRSARNLSGPELLNRVCQHTPVTRRSGLRVSIMNPSASAPSSVQTVA